MKDYNFFEGYILLKERKQKKVVLLFGFALLMLFAAFCIFTVYYSFELRLRSLRFHVETNEHFMASPYTLDSIQKRDMLNEQLEALRLYNTSVSQLASALEDNSYISTETLNEIERSIPKDTRLSSLSCDSSGTIGIDGVSEKKTSIAEFEHELSSLSIIDSVFVNNITLDDKTGIYSFTMNVNIKEVSTDEGAE